MILTSSNLYLLRLHLRYADDPKEEAVTAIGEPIARPGNSLVYSRWGVLRSNRGRSTHVHTYTPHRAGSLTPHLRRYMESMNFLQKLSFHFFARDSVSPISLPSDDPPLHFHFVQVCEVHVLHLTILG